MTTYSQTVSNRVNCFGSPSDTWSSGTTWPAMTWGGKWGYGTSALQKFIYRDTPMVSTLVATSEIGTNPKWIWNTQTVSQNATTKTFTKAIDLTQAVATAQYITFSKLLESTMAITADMYGQYIIDSRGYYTVFDGRDENAENRVFTSYSTAGYADSTWTVAAYTSTVWS